MGDGADQQLWFPLNALLLKQQLDWEYCMGGKPKGIAICLLSIMAMWQVWKDFHKMIGVDWYKRRVTAMVQYRYLDWTTNHSMDNLG